MVQAGRFGGKKEGLKEDTHRLPSVVLPVSTTPHSDVSDRYGVTMRLDPGGGCSSIVEGRRQRGLSPEAHPLARSKTFDRSKVRPQSASSR